MILGGELEHWVQQQQSRDRPAFPERFSVDAYPGAGKNDFSIKVIFY